VVAVRLEPMTEEQYVEYRASAEAEYGRNIAASGAMAESDARAQAAEDFARLLPDGLRSEGHVFFSAYDVAADPERGGEAHDAVGMLWLHLEEKSDGWHAFGYDLEVREDLHRQGYGRAVMVAAEQECRERGVVAVRLNVFGFNRGAQALYELMGFEVTNVLMTKRLDGSPTGA
jgi:ribosomal protein S18 acetylase RimI-like enzyme